MRILFRLLLLSAPGLNCQRVHKVKGKQSLNCD